MAEYIERKMLKSEMTEAMCGTGYQQWAIDVIDRLPTADVVEVVRCKDCEYFVIKPNYRLCSHKLNRIFKSPLEVSSNHFCSYGKRKEGVEE